MGIQVGRRKLEWLVADFCSQPEHIRSHPQAKYEATAAVLAGAQRQGLNKLGILGTEKFGN